MNDFKILINTDTFYKEGSPHLVATVIGDNDVNNREDVYKDVIGFYKKIPHMYDIDNSTIKEMDDWADILKKNIIILIENDSKLIGWLFEFGEDISYREIQASSLNDINYDIWLDPDANFWNPVDFLLEEEYYTPVNYEGDNINDKLKCIEESIMKLDTKISKLVDNIKEIT